MATPTPYLGSKICLISKAEIRYEGILYTIDSKESTVALAKVRSFGTEDRKTETPFPPRDEIFEYIIFKAADIKDLRVCQPPMPSLAQDPAIVSHSMGPPAPPAGGAPSFGDFSGTPYGQQPPMFMPPQQSPFGSALGLSPGSLMTGPGGPLPASDPNLGGFGPKVAPCGPIVEASRTSSPDAAKHQEHHRGGGGGGDDDDEEHHRPGHSTNSNYRGGNAEGYNNNNNNSGGSSSKRDGPKNENYSREHYQQRRVGPPGSSQDYGHGGGGYAPVRGRGGGGAGGGGGMGRGRGMGGLRPRGQLQANKEPLKFDEEFDFEQANLEFQELESKMAKTKISDGIADDESYSWSEDENLEEAKSEGRSAHQDEPAEYYNKSKSFFDQISCEALERQNGANTGRVDWRHERSINKETFGVSAPPSWGYRRGGWNGSYNNYRGRGGYGYNRSRGYGGNSRNYDNRGHGGNQGGYGGYGGNRSYDNRNRNNGPPRGGHRGPRPAPPQQA